MEVIPGNKVIDGKAINYLPHHAVMKDGSTATKVRVVFDGPAKTSTGISFNEVLRFGQHPIVLFADIAQMYRQINIDKNNTTFKELYGRRIRLFQSFTIDSKPLHMVPLRLHI